MQQKYNTSLKAVNQDMPVRVQYGDYDYSKDEIDIGTIDEAVRSEVIDNMMSSVKDKLLAQNGLHVYTPERVYELSDAGTINAAFYYAFYLRKMGATIVGVPSSQVPNTYMETTPF